MKKNKANYIFIAVIFLLILNSCGSSGVTAPGKPTALDPDPENPNKIEIYWKAVDGADIYYVYRSTTENGTYSNEGFSVTSKEVDLSDGETELRYSFINAFEEGDGGTYWYGIKAASNSDITAESTMSPVVEASTYSGTWGAAKELGTAAQLKLVADNTNLWAVYSLGVGADAISVQKYAEDQTSEADEPPKVWNPITTSMVTNGNVNNPFSIFINGGELYTVFADSGATSAGAVSIQNYYNWGTTEAPSYSWEIVGTEGFNSAASTEITAVAVGFGSTDIYSAFLEGVDGQLYVNDVEIELSLIDVEDVQLLNNNNTLFYGYEKDSKYYQRELNTNLKTLEPEAGTEVALSAIDDGNIDFVSGGGNLYAVYITDIDGTPNNGDGSLVVKKYEDSNWNQISTSASLDATDAYPFGTLDAHWFNGYLYVFYINSTDSKGWVKYYDEDEGWQNAQKNGGAAITGAGSISKVQLASAGNTLYAGYIEVDKAYVRILK